MTGLLVLIAAPALAAPTFPALTGRVVDDANILSPQAEADLTGKLAALEQATGRQLVVVTIPSLQGYEIEDFGYQLGRTWGIGEKGKNTGALFIIAPNERKTRIEAGYGLEPVLTDALSSVILQRVVLPRFKAGDMPGGIVAGTDAIIQQLSLPDDEARAKAAEPAPQAAGRSFPPWAGVVILVFVAFMIRSLFSGGGGRGGGAGGLGGALPWIVLGALGSGGGRGRSDWGGGGGGGFSGGGGSFGGGGSSGSW
jgi:uncharacterized protein